MVALSSIDLAVVGLYLVVVIAFGLWAGRGARDATDYFLAGRALPWYLIGFSFYASNMSGASFVGLNSRRPSPYRSAIRVPGREPSRSVASGRRARGFVPAS